MITLKNLHEASEQEIFDQVAAHLLNQKRRSVNDRNSCRYRGNDGLKCAAGCLIADDEYSAEMEGIEWQSLAGTYALVPPYHKILIDHLQLVHDQYEPLRWVEGLNNVAKKYRLTPVSYKYETD